MEHDDIKLILIELYEKNQRRLSGNKKYKFDLTESRNEILDKFIENISKRVDVIGVDILKSYMIYAFGSYAGRGIMGNPAAFSVKWIISFNLFLKFLSDKSGKKYALKKNLQRQRKELIKNKINIIGDKKVNNKLQEIETDFEKRERKKEQKILMNEIDEFEEIEKLRFHNKIKGRLWCVDFTTLYNEKSEACSDCKFKQSCKQTLKEYLPNIYKLRNE